MMSVFIGIKSYASSTEILPSRERKSLILKTFHLSFLSVCFQAYTLQATYESLFSSGIILHTSKRQLRGLGGSPL